MSRQITQPELGKRLRRLRTERGLSQRDLATGSVNQSYISLLEKGARVPTLEVVMQLAKALDVPVRALIGDVELPAAGDDRNGGQLVQDLLTSSAIEHGDLGQAQVRLTAAYRAARGTGPANAVLHHGLALERVLDLRNLHEPRYELLAELVTVAEQSGVPEAVVRTRIALAGAARDVGKLGEALTSVEAAEQEIRDTAFVRGAEHVRLLAVHASVLSDAGGGIEVERILDRMLAMADELGSPPISGRAHWVASITLARLGAVDRSLGHLRAAREMLAHPGTSLRDWARFSRAAASALLDAGADLPEVTTHMQAARAATAATEALADPSASISLEVRYSLACGEPERALEIASTLDDGDLSGIERVRFVLAVGRAQRRCGRSEEATATLRRAAQLAEDAAAYRRAAEIWREAAE
jgi:transcriptional regulator with XRE-family HTH domain